MSRLYKRILRDADAHFREARGRYRDQMQCGVGCTFCCYGLFEIGGADVAVIADGLRALPAELRADLVARAEKLMESTQYPDLRSIPPAEKEAFFDRTEAVPCPALEEDGRCRIYESRPLVCRTFGLPIRDGAQYIGDICELNFTDAAQEIREDAAWDLQNEDELGPEDEYTVPEAIVIAARLLKTRRR